jgi:hypothetical protein
MKINYVQTLLTMALSINLAYGFFTFYDSEYAIHLSSGGVLFIIFTFLFSIIANFEFPETTIEIRTVSLIFFLIVVCSNLVITFVNLSVPLYIVSNGVLLLGYVILMKTLLFKQKRTREIVSEY